MTGEAQDHVALARWQRMLLPGELRDDVDGRRSARDWVVDVAHVPRRGRPSAGSSLVTTWDDHGRPRRSSSTSRSARSTFVALWWRRSLPVAVGVATGIASIVSAAASGPALLVACFNVASAARRARGRSLAIAGLALVSTATFPLVYPGDGDVR